MKREPIAPPSTRGAFRVSRREFLVASGLGSLWTLFGRAEEQAFSTIQGVRYNDPLQPLIFTVDRARDLLSLEVELLNFMPVRQKGAATPGAKHEDGFAFHIASYARPGYVIVRIGGQHIAEQAIWDRPVVDEKASPDSAASRPLTTYILDESSGWQNDDVKFLKEGRYDKEGKLLPNMLEGLAGAWLAGHSQIVFEVPQRLTPLSFDLDAILRLCVGSCAMRVHPRLEEKEPPGEFFTGSRHEEQRLQRPYLGHHDTNAPYTSIEFPSLLYISPYANGQWHLRPSSWGSRWELWSLDLQRPLLEEAVTGRPRAIQRQGHLYAFDTEERGGRWPGQAQTVLDPANKYAGGETPKTSLYGATRKLLVGQMAEDNGDILAEDFRLTAVGATAHLEYRPLVTPRLKTPTDRPTPAEGQPKNLARKPVGDGRTQEVTFSDQRPGFLTEWIQKTEIGRDYFVKEAFAGYWFPFQLPAEAVTITERLMSARWPAGERPTNKKTQPLPAAGDEAKEKKEDEDYQRDFVGTVESRLTAFLVARKFAIVKERVREFGGPESDDFDDIGAQIARAMGVRKIEILVDRTPVLSNQGTSSFSAGGDREVEIAQRLSNGEDAVYVTGGSGDDAGREVFWPRVAVAPPEPGHDLQASQRQLTVYRFPVRLTMIDGQEKETHFPMLFCYDWQRGPGYYNLAPAALRTLPVGGKVALALAQNAGALNATDLALEEAPLLGEALNVSKLFATKVLTNDLEGPLKTAVLAQCVSSLLGGVREQLYDHVAKFKEKAQAFCKDKGGDFKTSAVGGLVDGVLNRLPESIYQTKGEQYALNRELIKQSVLRVIAWGEKAHLGVTVARASQRLTDALELLKCQRASLGSDADPAAWPGALSLLLGTTLPAVPEAQKASIGAAHAALSAEARKRLLEVMTKAGVTADMTLEKFEVKFPTLQVQWVALLGPDWQRIQWDGWFAELFRQIDFDLPVKSPCWVGPLSSVIQKGHAQFLMEGGISKGTDSLAELWGDAVNLSPLRPMEELAARVSDEKKETLPFAAPATLLASVQGALSRLPGDVKQEGAGALRRLRTAIEDALPDERVLRQRAQHLVEDYEYLLAQGDRTRQLAEAELASLQQAASVQLAHLAAHVDGGVRRAERFLSGVAREVEHVSPHLAQIEQKARDWMEGLTGKIKLPDAIVDVPQKVRTRFDALVQEKNPLKSPENIEAVKAVLTNDRALRHLLESAPAQSLNHFKNLLHETGSGLAGEMEERLLQLGTLVRAGWSDQAAAAERLQGYEDAVQQKAMATLGTLRGLAADHRRQRLRLLEEVRRVISPWRGSLAALLGRLEQAGEMTFGTGATLENGSPARVAALLVTGEEGTLPGRLGGRLSDLLARLRPGEGLTADEPPGLARPRSEARQPSEKQLGIARLEARIEGELARFWQVRKELAEEALQELARQGAQYGGALKQEIDALKKAVDHELAQTTWQRLDAVEQMVLMLLADRENVLRAVLTKLLAPLALGAVKDEILAKLTKSWATMTPKLEAIQKKLGQSVGLMSKLRTGEFSGPVKEIDNELRQVMTYVGAELQAREKFLEGAGLSLVNKAKLALHCPSLIKNYRDEAAKATYHVQEFVVGMQANVAAAGAKLEDQVSSVLQDARNAVGFPLIKTLKARIPNVELPQAIEHTKEYLEHGLRGAQKEAAGAFARVKAAADSLAQESGLANAASKVQALSRDLGGLAEKAKDQIKAVQGEIDNVRKFAEGKIDDLKGSAKVAVDAFVDDTLKDLIPEGSKLFGVLPINKILEVIKSPDKGPQMLANELPDRIERSYTWINEARGFSLPGGLLKFEPDRLDGAKPCQFKLVNTATIWVPKPGQPKRDPELFTRGHLDSFSLQIAGMLKLYFKSVAFTARNGHFDFKPALGRAQGNAPAPAGSGGGGGDDASNSFMSFMGPLEVVDRLRQTLSSFLQGKNGPVIEIDGDRILAGYKIGLPALAFGAVVIENISLSMALTLPLKSGPLAFVFRLCERMQPFRVAVSGFTGGGYLGVQVSPDRRLCWVEGALEFGGSLSFNIAVASGELYLMAGVYFRMEHAGVTLSGYIRAGGRVLVLGFIELTIQFYLALFYRKRQGQTQFWGQCTISVRIKIGFFKKTVRLSMEKVFSGSESTSDEGDDSGSTGWLQRSPARLYASLQPMAGMLLAQNEPAGGGSSTPRKEIPPEPPVRFKDLFPDPSDWAAYWRSFAS